MITERTRGAWKAEYLALVFYSIGLWITGCVVTVFPQSTHLSYSNLHLRRHHHENPLRPDPSPSSIEDDAIVQRIQGRRHARPLQPLDLVLLHSPPVADGWITFLGNVRTKTLIADDVRELAICRVVIINRAWYKWMHHAPFAVKGGVLEEDMEAIKTEKPLLRGQQPSALNEKQWAVSVLSDETTRNF